MRQRRSGVRMRQGCTRSEYASGHACRMDPFFVHAPGGAFQQTHAGLACLRRGVGGWQGGIDLGAPEWGHARRGERA